MSGGDRRAFLKRLALASAAAAASSLIPGISFGTGLGLASGASSDLTWRKAPCGLCEVGCGLLVGIEEGRAVAVRGDPQSPVNRGLACARGYHSVQALYGPDRLGRALVRRDGRLVAVGIQEALDLVALRLRQTVAEHGPDGVAIYGSGHWTLPTAYVAGKLFKGVIGTNNVDASARLDTAAASAGARSSTGLDHFLGCYEDIDHADVFVLWGSNLAETHPVLFSRILERRQRSPATRIIQLGTRATRTGYAADRFLLFAPHSELAIANAVCHEIVARNWANRDFLERHVSFKRGRTGLGYGQDDSHEFRDEAGDVTWSNFVRFLDDYTPARASQISALPAAEIRWLASLYGDRSRTVLSVWGSELNQHARGTWANNLVHNIHLLVGKIASPGNGVLALGGQPNAAATLRAVGAMSEALPSGEVAQAADRATAARLWATPDAGPAAGAGSHALGIFRGLERGDIRFLWVQAANPMVSLPDLTRYRAAVAGEGRFLVVSEVYPTATTDLADVVLPSALWIEQEGIYGNAERRTQHFDQMLPPPGDALNDTLQLIEVARRLGNESLFPWTPGNHVPAIWEEYSRFRELPRDRMATMAELRSRPGTIWPFVDGREATWRCNTAYDPAADPAFGAFDFYGHPDHRAWIWLRPYEPPAEAPDADYPFWLSVGGVLEHSGTGTLTRRIPVLHRAMPGAYVEIHRTDADRLGIRDADPVRVSSRRGSILLPARVDFRSQPPPGHVFIPVFDESAGANRITLDALCPISGQPDYQKCAVRVELPGTTRGS